jgi:GNAT superfamily N-acetyltransferase
VGEGAVRAGDYAVREASAVDFPAIRRVEQTASARFRDVGMPDVADIPVLATEVLARLVEEGVVFVVTHGERIVGFAAVGPLDDAAYLVELDVVPEHAGYKLGARLIDRVESWAGDRGIARITLATYRDVPWNAPYYARLGFREVAPGALGPEHLADWKAQGEHGLDLTKRLFMERPTRRSGISRREGPVARSSR